MTYSLQDTLRALCSSVEPLVGNEHQEVYVLADAKEARIAADILHAHGFDVKLYPDQASAKLYYTYPLMPDDMLTERLNTAYAYAVAFKKIKLSLDALCAEPTAHMNDYAVSCSSNSSGLQLGIHVISDKIGKKQIINPKVVASGTTQALPQTSKSTKIAATQSTKAPASQESDILGAGPRMGTEYKKYSKKDRGEEDAKDAKNAAMRFFVKHIASNTVQILSVITFILILSGIAVAAKGFLCPDLATVKSKEWYCLSDEEKKMKPEEP